MCAGQAAEERDVGLALAWDSFLPHRRACGLQCQSGQSTICSCGLPWLTRIACSGEWGSGKCAHQRWQAGCLGDRQRQHWGCGEWVPTGCVSQIYFSGVWFWRLFMMLIFEILGEDFFNLQITLLSADFDLDQWRIEQVDVKLADLDTSWFVFRWKLARWWRRGWRYQRTRPLSLMCTRWSFLSMHF